MRQMLPAAQVAAACTAPLLMLNEAKCRANNDT